MNNNKLRKLCALTILIFVLTSQITLLSQASNTIPDNQEPPLVYDKNQYIEVVYSPLGEILSEVVKVEIEIYNNSSSQALFYLKDRIESINLNTLKMLYGTPIPTSIETFGNITIITWNDLTIEADETIVYEYIAEMYQSIPIDIDENVYVNGNMAKLNQLGNIFTFNAEVSDTVVFEINLTNIGQPLYAKGKSITPEVSSTITYSLSDDYFSNIVTTPEANSTSSINDVSSFVWLISLNDSVVLNISTEIGEISSWGEAPVEPFTIQLTSTPESVETRLEDLIDNLENSIKVLRSQRDGINRMPGFLKGFFQSALNGLNNQINELNKEKVDLEYQLLSIQNQRIPFNVEVYKEDSKCNYEVDTTIKKHRVLAESTQWSIESIKVKNTGNSTLVINGLSFKIKNTQTQLQPKYVLIHSSQDRQIYQKYETFTGNLRQIGVTFDEKTNSSYLWPRIVINSSETKNILVDWAERPIQIIFESEIEPQLELTIDVEKRHPFVYVEKVENNIVCSVLQPNAISQNLTIPEYNPSPPSGDDRTIGNFLFSPLILLFIVCTVVVFVLLIQNRRKQNIVTTIKDIKNDEDIENILDEINDIKKELENQENLV